LSAALLPLWLLSPAACLAAAAAVFERRLAVSRGKNGVARRPLLLALALLPAGQKPPHRRCPAQYFINHKY